MTSDPSTNDPAPEDHTAPEPESSHTGGSSMGFTLLAMSPLFFLCGIAFPLMHILAALCFLGFLIWYPLHRMHQHPR